VVVDADRFGCGWAGLSEARRVPRRERFCPPRYPGCAGDVFASDCLGWAGADEGQMKVRRESVGQ
jgi:hypothetical protein